MIDKTAFAAEMTILQDRFNRRDMTPETVARYLDFLNPLMTTEEFCVAAREVFNRDTFWPSPQRFLEVMRGEPRVIAQASWERLLGGARQGKLPDLSDVERDALKVVGGFVAIERCESPYRLGELRKAYERELAERLASPSHPLMLGGAS